MVVPRFLAITDHPAMNICVYRFLRGCKFSFLWDKCPGVKLLGHMVNVYLVFEETATFQVALSFYIPNGAMSQ